MSPAYRTAAIVAALGLLRTTAACAGAADGGVEDATSAKRDTELTHEPCDLGAEGARKVDVDKTEARFVNGLLTVTMPKAEDGSTRRVHVQ